MNSCTMERYYVKVQQCKVTKNHSGITSQQDTFGEMENGAQCYKLLITLLKVVV